MKQKVKVPMNPTRLARLVKLADNKKSLAETIASLLERGLNNRNK